MLIDAHVFVARCTGSHCGRLQSLSSKPTTVFRMDEDCVACPSHCIRSSIFNNSEIFTDEGEVGCGRTKELARVVKPQSRVKNIEQKKQKKKYKRCNGESCNAGTGCVQIRGDLAPTSRLGPKLILGQNGVSQNGYGQRMPPIPPSSLHPPQANKLPKRVGGVGAKVQH